MKVTRPFVLKKAEEYRDEEPLYAVELEQIELLPKAFASGDYGWRDAEWVVQWYYRRFLGAYPDDKRQAIEEQFQHNDFEIVRQAITDVQTVSTVTEKINYLTELSAIDVPLASAFLMFLNPDAYIVIGEREWTALSEGTTLSPQYPNPPSIADYETYLDICRSLIQRFDCDLWTLYQAFWRISKE